MRLQRGFTNKEWKEISEKYKDGGVHIYRGKKTYFYNGEKLWDWDNDDEDCGGWPIIYDKEERESWEVIIFLPGVEIIRDSTFHRCKNIKMVIMADTVRRIEYASFKGCRSLEFVKLSRNLEFIGEWAFYLCLSLTSIFIPPSCSQIGDMAFYLCKKLVILGLSQNVELGSSVFQGTVLIKASPIETCDYGCYDRNDENEAVRWVKSINNTDTYALHRACSSFNPLADIIHDLVKRQGIESMRKKNVIGITPSQYLEANTFADISEKEILNKYISEMMGEVL